MRWKVFGQRLPGGRRPIEPSQRFFFTFFIPLPTASEALPVASQTCCQLPVASETFSAAVEALLIAAEEIALRNSPSASKALPLKPPLKPHLPL